MTTPGLNGKMQGADIGTQRERIMWHGPLMGALTFSRVAQAVHSDVHPTPTFCALQSGGGGSSSLTQTEAEGQGSTYRPACRRAHTQWCRSFLTVASQYPLVWPVPIFLISLHTTH